MMKSKDCAVATALIIQGFLYANADEGPGLAEAIAAIRLECDDWEENLEPTAVRPLIEGHVVKGGVNPYPSQIRTRPAAPAPIARVASSEAEISVLIEAADDLVAEIDAATERPVGKLALWDVAVQKLRTLGVEPTGRCMAPANW